MSDEPDGGLCIVFYIRREYSVHIAMLIEGYIFQIHGFEFFEEVFGDVPLLWCRGACSAIGITCGVYFHIVQEPLE